MDENIFLLALFFVGLMGVLALAAFLADYLEKKYPHKPH